MDVENLLNQKCPVTTTLDLINRKWALHIIYDIFTGKTHFNQFKEAHEGLSSTVLSDSLKFLEKNQIITKTVCEDDSMITEYGLTEKGRRLNTILFDMAMFGSEELNYDSETKKEVKTHYENILNLK